MGSRKNLEPSGNKAPSVDWNQVEWWDIGQLTPYPQNAKAHPPAQVDRLARAIATFGWDVPIVVDEEGVILKGHGRRLAAQKLNAALVPVIVRKGLSETEKQAIRLSDNKLAESDWIDEILAAELKALNAVNFDLELAGFTDEEFQKLLEGPSGEPNNGGNGGGDGAGQGGGDGSGGSGGSGDGGDWNKQRSEIECHCPNCGHEFLRQL